jgi:hypothetical protein
MAHTVTMANQAQLIIRVRSSRGASTVQYSTKGRYVSLVTNTLTNQLVQQPIQPTSTPQAFWGSILDIVEFDITGHL